MAQQFPAVDRCWSCGLDLNRPEGYTIIVEHGSTPRCARCHNLLYQLLGYGEAWTLTPCGHPAPPEVIEQARLLMEAGAAVSWSAVVCPTCRRRAPSIQCETFLVDMAGRRVL